MCKLITANFAPPFQLQNLPRKEIRKKEPDYLTQHWPCTDSSIYCCSKLIIRLHTQGRAIYSKHFLLMFLRVFAIFWTQPSFLTRLSSRQLGARRLTFLRAELTMQTRLLTAAQSGSFSAMQAIDAVHDTRSLQTTNNIYKYQQQQHHHKTKQNTKIEFENRTFQQKKSIFTLHVRVRRVAKRCYESNVSRNIKEYYKTFFFFLSSCGSEGGLSTSRDCEKHEENAKNHERRPDD
jgi:hypothetical protein